MMTSIEQLIFEIHNDRAERTAETLRKPRTRWTPQEDNLFEHLVACYGSDYSLLGSFLPRKTQKQIKKKYRQMLRFRSDRLDRLEREIANAKKKAYFDQLLASDVELSSSSSSPRSSSPDESSQSLQWGRKAL